MSKKAAVGSSYKARLADLARLFANPDRRKQAERELDRFLREYQAEPDALRGAARLLAEVGHVTEALGVLDDACRRLPEKAGLLCEAAVILLRSDRPQEASRALKAAIQSDPRSHEPHLLLGHLLQRRKRWDAAVSAFREALKRKPDDPECELGLATALQNWGRAHLAIPHFRNVREARPNSIEAAGGLALTQRLVGDFEAALTTYRAAKRIRPDSAVLIAGEAETLASLRRNDEALELLKPLITRSPVHSAVVSAFARIAPSAGFADQAIALCERSLRDVHERSTDRVAIYFSLGQLYESAGQFERAFAAFQRGNAGYGPSPFRAAEYAGFVDELRAAFSVERLSSLPRSANRSALPVFIVGMPRSGTSLVEQILAAHPRVFGAGELRDIPELFVTLPERIGVSTTYPACLASATADLMERLAAEHLARLGELAPDAERITDKMPENFQHLGLIQLLLPGARVVHCVRDPLDTCLSCFTTMLSAAHIYARDLLHLGQFFREYRRLMDHWKNVLDLPLLDVGYEGLVSDPEPNVRRLLEFCGLEWNDACLQFHQSRRVSLTASIDQVRRPIYSSSVGRAERYGALLDPLREALAGAGAST